MQSETAIMFNNTLRNNTFFLIPFLLVLIVLVPVVVIIPKPEIHLWINRHHSVFADWFFRHITFLGDGLFVILPALIMLFFSLRHFVFLLSAYFSTGLLTQLLKRLLFEDVVRPSRYFDDSVTLYLVDGVRMLSGRSFPSGHATSAFALFLCLSLLSPNRYVKLACFVLACLTAFSRVYLSQHFLVDIVAGSIIGAAGALAFYVILYRQHHKWHTWRIQKIFSHEAQV